MSRLKRLIPALAALALAAGAPAPAAVVFQVLNSTWSNWTLEPAVPGSVGTGQWIYNGHLLDLPVDYWPRPGAGKTLPPGYALEFVFDEKAIPSGAVSFHLCDQRWQYGQAADGGPANPRSVQLGFAWGAATCPTGSPTLHPWLGTAPGRPGVSQELLGKIGAWSGSTFTIIAANHDVLGIPAAGAVAAAEAPDGFEVLAEGWVAGAAGAGSGAGALPPATGLTDGLAGLLPRGGDPEGAAAPAGAPQTPQLVALPHGPAADASGAIASLPVPASLAIPPLEADPLEAGPADPEAAPDVAALPAQAPGGWGAASFPHLGLRAMAPLPLAAFPLDSGAGAGSAPAGRDQGQPSVYPVPASPARQQEALPGAGDPVPPAQDPPKQERKGCGHRMRVVIENRGQDAWILRGPVAVDIPVCLARLDGTGREFAVFARSQGLKGFRIPPRRVVELDLNKRMNRLHHKARLDALPAHALALPGEPVLRRYTLAPEGTAAAAGVAFGVAPRVIYTRVAGRRVTSTAPRLCPDPDAAGAGGLVTFDDERICIGDPAATVGALAAAPGDVSDPFQLPEGGSLPAPGPDATDPFLDLDAAWAAAGAPPQAGAP